MIKLQEIFGTGELKEKFGSLLPTCLATKISLPTGSKESSKMRQNGCSVLCYLRIFADNSDSPL
ncbi:hypothetical protein HOLleu_09357 [Holothuria leucospilota]|uniref:Uncharacterized protein n=1 Tax=Holothuria leucospilota TaxID=206669 RepID=A0A9Q1CCU1_HOLLE|nr:hypothetical protein HOLleu_09357 [Holothuria leucospilota]